MNNKEIGEALLAATIVGYTLAAFLMWIGH